MVEYGSLGARGSGFNTYPLPVGARGSGFNTYPLPVVFEMDSLSSTVLVQKVVVLSRHD